MLRIRVDAVLDVGAYETLNAASPAALSAEPCSSEQGRAEE